MANVKLIFQGTERSKSEDHDLQCYLNGENEIFICIDMDGMLRSYICLDKSTAIKLAKTIRTEINQMEEVDND